MEARNTEGMEQIGSGDGTPIAVWRTGAGPPLVLIHGTAADHSRWAPVLPELEERFTVLAMDRRGRGGSGDSEPYAVEREYEDVAAVVDAAGGSPSVLAHSYGASCALEGALLTDAIGKLMLYEPPAGFVAPPSELVRRLEALHGADERDELVSLFMREVAGVPGDQLESMRTMPAWEHRTAAAHTIPRELRATMEYELDPARFANVSTPTLLIQGAESPQAFRDAGEAVRGALRECRVAVLPGQRHTAMDTAPDLFLEAVTEFLDG